MKNKDYKYYKTEDFLTDEEFKSWILKSNSKSDYFWTKLMDSYPHKKKDILKAKEMLLLMKFKQHDVQDREKDQVLENIIQNIKSGHYHEAIKNDAGQYYFRENVQWWLKIAASFAILAASIFFVYNNSYIEKSRSGVKEVLTMTKSNPAGRKLTLQLPDGSTVSLNSESEISFPEHFNDSVRIVMLQGEAYFEVAHNEHQPFLVQTGNVTIHVLGTSFNVNAFRDNNEIAVSLIEGQVKVLIEGSEKILLEPFEKVIVNRQTLHISKTSFDNISEVGWKDGIIIFDEDDYRRVISKLERWYGVRFELLNVPSSDWKIKGMFKDMNLTQMLEHFKFMHNIEYKIEAKNVKIKFN
jgi:transmembrane sensor